MTVETGIVQTVLVRTVGDVLAANVSIGASTLTVVDAVEFDEGGGFLLVDDETIEYDACDDETGVITLVTPTTAAHTADANVYVVPPAFEKTAVVSLSADEEPVEVNVPHMLWDVLPEGVRDDEAEQVRLIQGDDGFELVDVVGSLPVIEGTYVDTSSLPTIPPSALTAVPPPALDDLEDGTYSGTMLVSGAITTRNVDPVTNKPTGAGQDLSPSGLFSYGPVDAAGAEQRRFEAPTDPALPHVFRGDAFIERLSTLVFSSLQASSLGEGAILTMLTGVQPAANAPTVSHEWTSTTLTIGGVPANRTYGGFALIGSSYYTARLDLSAGTLVVETWNATTGAQTAVTAYLTDASGMHGVTTDGTFLYALTDLLTSWRLTKIDPTDMSAISFGWNQAESGNLRPVALGYDASTNELLVAQSRDANGDIPRVSRYTPPTTALTRNSFLDLDSALGGNNGLSTVAYNTTDFAAARYVLSAGGAHAVRVYSTTGVRQVDDEWPAAGTNAVAGLLFTAGAWRSLDTAGVVYFYETDASLRWTSATSSTWYAAVAWRKSTGPYETPRSAVATFTAKKRARLRLTAPVAPTGGAQVPDQVRFLLERGAAMPAAGTMDSQALVTVTPGVAAQLVFTSVTFASATHDVTVNSFPGGSASRLSAGNSTFYVDGDGNGNVGTGTFRDSILTAQSADTTISAGGAFTGSIRFRRYGNRVVAYGAINRATGFNTAYTGIGVAVPAGMAPTSAVAVPPCMLFATSITYQFRVTAGGSPAVELRQEAASTLDMPFMAHWFID